MDPCHPGPPASARSIQTCASFEAAGSTVSAKGWWPENDASLRRTLSIVLADRRRASGLNAAAIYQFTEDRRHLDLVTANAPAAAPVRVPPGEAADAWAAALTRTLEQTMGEAGLRPLDILPLGSGSEPLGYLAVLSRDTLARARRPPAGEVLLRAAAELVGGVLESQRLIAELILEDSALPYVLLVFPVAHRELVAERVENAAAAEGSRDRAASERPAGARRSVGPRG
ncbi:MAG TPA: hypothetical protein VNG93_04765 [Candidatus Dormibacteraeota bacterium]|nr:hypothetical protein [Candidatus Dormibacteraeota bacterium]